MKKLIAVLAFVLISIPAYCMTEAEIQAKIESKYDIVLSYENDGSNGPIQWKRAKVFDFVDDQYLDGMARYGVKDGVAGWRGREPKKNSVPTFNDKLQAYIKTEITKGTFKQAHSVYSDENTLTGSAVVVVLSAEKKAIFKEKLGVITHEILDSVISGTTNL